ncbi:MAG: hypothetical protein P9L92_15335 [Candidatus Electryonea clarkiae]|nr:hypothetical protein [Candidatus Electryonea clarkiae]
MITIGLCFSIKNYLFLGYIFAIVDAMFFTYGLGILFIYIFWVEHYLKVKNSLNISILEYYIGLIVSHYKNQDNFGVKELDFVFATFLLIPLLGIFIIVGLYCPIIVSNKAFLYLLDKIPYIIASYVDPLADKFINYNIYLLLIYFMQIISFICFSGNLIDMLRKKYSNKKAGIIYLCIVFILIIIPITIIFSLYEFAVLILYCIPAMAFCKYILKILNIDINTTNVYHKIIIFIICIVILSPPIIYTSLKNPISNISDINRSPFSYESLYEALLDPNISLFESKFNSVLIEDEWLKSGPSDTSSLIVNIGSGKTVYPEIRQIRKQIPWIIIRWSDDNGVLYTGYLNSNNIRCVETPKIEDIKRFLSVFIDLFPSNFFNKSILLLFIIGSLLVRIGPKYFGRYFPAVNKRWVIYNLLLSAILTTNILIMSLSNYTGIVDSNMNSIGLLLLLFFTGISFLIGMILEFIVVHILSIPIIIVLKYYLWNKHTSSLRYYCELLRFINPKSKLVHEIESIYYFCSARYDLALNSIEKAQKNNINGRIILRKLCMYYLANRWKEGMVFANKNLSSIKKKYRADVLTYKYLMQYNIYKTDEKNEILLKYYNNIIKYIAKDKDTTAYLTKRMK